MSLVVVVRRQERRDASTDAHARGTVGSAPGRAEVRDVLGDGVLRADGARIDAVGLPGFRQGVVARVEVLALLEVLGEVVGPGGEFAVQAEEALFFWGEGLGR
jgi:hypothetical protein